MNVGAQGGPAQRSMVEIRLRIADMIACRINGELDRFLHYFSKDATIYYSSTKPGLFSRGVMKGREDFRDNLLRTEEQYRGIDYEIVEILVEADRSWVRWRSRWRHVGKNRINSVEMANFLLWRNDEVAEMREFFDSAAPPIAGHGLIKNFENLLLPPSPGLDRDQMITRVQQLAAAQAAPDANCKLFRDYYAQDVVSNFVGEQSRIPYAGKRVGVEALIDIIRAVDTEFEQLDQSLSDIVVEGGRVACRRHLKWRHRGTGRRGSVDLADFLRFESGLIVELLELRDSSTVIALQGGMDDRL